MKHLHQCFVAIVLMLSFGHSLSAHDCEVDGIYYNLNNDDMTACVTYHYYYYYHLTSKIVIPENIVVDDNIYCVTSIDWYAFSGCSRLETIEIPNTITEIGSEAFKDCSSLIGIELPNNLNSIGVNVFQNCSELRYIYCYATTPPWGYEEGISDVHSSCTLYVPEESIEEYRSSQYWNNFANISQLLYYSFDLWDKTATITYKGDSYEEYEEYSGNIVIPESVIYKGEVYQVTSIDYSAFARCRSLTSISIPESVINIGGHAFRDCSSLTDITLPNSITSIDNYAFERCGSLTSITIPEGVRSIGEGTFCDCWYLTHINVDENNPEYASIDGILCNKNKTNLICCPGGKEGEISIPNTITTITSSAFSYCRWVTNIVIPNSVTTIGDCAFGECKNLNNIFIPNSVVGSLHSSSFSNCQNLKSIDVETDNPQYTSIDGILYDKNITTIICCPDGKRDNVIIIPTTVTKVGSGAFDGCWNITNIVLPEGVTEIGGSAFEMCGKYPFIVNIPKSVTQIGERAFWKSNLKKINIPNGITTIEDHTFYDCNSLSIVTIPKSVTSIGYGAFWNCYSLDTMYCYATTPPSIAGKSTFDWVLGYDRHVLMVPTKSVEAAYKSSEYWKDFDEIIGMSPDYDFEITITSAGYATFYSDKAIQLPEDVTAYYGKLSAGNEWLDLYEIANGKVPANTAVVLKADPETYGAWYLKKSAAKVNGNSLFGYTSDVPTSLINSIGFDVYTLAQENGVVGFYKYTGETLHAGKAFLRMDQSAKAPKMRIMGSETDIEYISSENNASKSVVYDLQGRRVNDMSRKGIYVVNGKKVVVR